MLFYVLFTSHPFVLLELTKGIKNEAINLGREVRFMKEEMGDMGKEGGL